MKSDTMIKSEGMKAIRSRLGLVEAERFILLIKKEPFDYTKWQADLWEDKSVGDVYAAAERLHSQKNASQP